MFIDSLDGLEQCPDLELEWVHNGMETMPCYLITCIDEHTYLIVAPDMDAARHIHAYRSLWKRVKMRMSDHMYDPLRPCFEPAYSNTKDEHGEYKVFHAPASEVGKIFLVK